MKERPVLFSGEMVRAILADRKTQTRRVVRIPGLEPGATHLYPVPKHAQETRSGWEFSFDGGFDRDVRCPYGEPGTRLWVRETWAPFDWFNGSEREEPVDVAYRADLSAMSREHGNVHTIDTYAANWDRVKWKPSIFMPRWASRITLDVTGVRVERLADITEEDVHAEGVISHIAEHTFRKAYRDDAERLAKAREYFAEKWNAINGKRAPWASNPWVWVVEFRRVAQAEAAA